MSLPVIPCTNCSVKFRQHPSRKNDHDLCFTCKKEKHDRAQYWKKGRKKVAHSGVGKKTTSLLAFGHDGGDRVESGQSPNYPSHPSVGDY